MIKKIKNRTIDVGVFSIAALVTVCWLTYFFSSLLFELIKNSWAEYD